MRVVEAIEGEGPGALPLARRVAPRRVQCSAVEEVPVPAQ